LATKSVPKIFSKLGLIGLGAVSFLFFLYLTFPYQVLKESITSSLNKQTSVNIRIGELSSHFPIGVELDNLKISVPGQVKTLTVKHVVASVSLWRFFLGQLGLSFELESNNKKTLEVDLVFKLFSLINGVVAPSKISLESDGFEIDGYLDFALANIASGPGANPLLSGLLTQIQLVGNLVGSAELDLDMNSPTRSKGQMMLRLADGMLTINDPSLNIAPQKFSKFVLQSQMRDAKFEINNNSGFVTQEMNVDLDGYIDLKNNFEDSQLNVNLSVKLDKSLKQSLGLIVEIVMGGRDGQGKIRIVGPIVRPKTIKI